MQAHESVDIIINGEIITDFYHVQAAIVQLSHDEKFIILQEYLKNDTDHEIDTIVENIQHIIQVHMIGYIQVTITYGDEVVIFKQMTGDGHHQIHLHEECDHVRMDIMYQVNENGVN